MVNWVEFLLKNGKITGEQACMCYTICSSDKPSSSELNPMGDDSKSMSTGNGTSIHFNVYFRQINHVNQATRINQK